MNILANSDTQYPTKALALYFLDAEIYVTNYLTN
jgi:hypothetical protein